MGRLGEDAAVAHLQARGLRVLRRNVHVGHGEIDIIALDGDELAFVEVRTLDRATMLKTPEQSANLYKQLQMQRAARGFARACRLKVLTARIDFVAVEVFEGRVVAIRHHQNAVSFNVTMAMGRGND